MIIIIYDNTSFRVRRCSYVFFFFTNYRYWSFSTVIRCPLWNLESRLNRYQTLNMFIFYSAYRVWCILTNTNYTFFFFFFSWKIQDLTLTTVDERQKIEEKSRQKKKMSSIKDRRLDVAIYAFEFQFSRRKFKWFTWILLGYFRMWLCTVIPTNSSVWLFFFFF